MAKFCDGDAVVITATVPTRHAGHYYLFVGQKTTVITAVYKNPHFPELYPPGNVCTIAEGYLMSDSWLEFDGDPPCRCEMCVERRSDRG